MKTTFNTIIMMKNKLFISALFLGVIVLLSPDVNAQTKLVAQYKFDHEGADTIAIDASDNDLDLVLSNTDASTWSDDGVVSGCLNTAGIRGGKIEDDSLFQVQTFTFATYVRINAENTDGNFLMAQGSSYGLWALDDGALRFYCQYAHFAEDTTYGWVGTNTVDVNLKDGYWHHVAVTFDSTDMVATIYLDGESVASDTVRTGDGITPPEHSQIRFPQNGFYVGCSSDEDNFLDGSIDEAVFYHSKLSEEEIKELVISRYELTTGVIGNGTVSPAKGLFYANDTLMLTALPDNGWEFEKWDESGTVTGTDNPVIITVSNTAVVAKAVFTESTGMQEINALTGVSVYPNPFHNGVTISYNLEDISQVVVSVYNITGKRVNILVNEKQATGTKTIYWNGTDLNGNMVLPGMYIIQLQTNDKVITRNLINVK